MTTAADADTTEPLRSLAASLQARGPRTARRRVVVLVVWAGAAVALARGPFGVPGDVAGFVLLCLWFPHADSVQHEAAHRHVARTGRGNRLAGLLASIPMLVPYSWYRAYHVAHHASTATAGDPEGRHEPAARLPWLIESGRTARFWVRIWRDTVRTTAGRPPSYIRTVRQQRDVRVDGLITLAAGTVLVGAAVVEPAFRWAWLGPLVVYVLVLFPLFHTYEHAGAETRAEADPDLGPLARTSTLRLPHLASAALMHATFHTAHHAYPHVPWKQLPELHRALEPLLPPGIVHEHVIAYLRSAGRPSPGGEAVEASSHASYPPRTDAGGRARR